MNIHGIAVGIIHHVLLFLYSITTRSSNNECIWFRIEPQEKVNYDRISEVLIQKGADVTAINAHGLTVLHDAAQYGWLFFVCFYENKFQFIQSI